MLILLGIGVFCCLVCIMYFCAYHMHLRPVKYMQSHQMNGKTIVITGGSSGIGYETALNLASRGARIIIASRNQLKGERAAKRIINITGNTGVFYEHLDLADLKSVKSFADHIKGTEVRLDVLINNAALSYHKEARSKYGHDTVYASNYLGHFLLTFLLLDLLKQSAPSRIINVSSVAHRYMNSGLNFSVHDDKYGDLLYPHLEGYDVSKLSQVLHVKELARRLAGTGVTANVVHPGLVLTKLWDDMNILFFQWMTNCMKLLARPLAVSAESASQTTVFCAVSPELEGISGKYYSRCAEDKVAAAARGKATSAQLWDVSMVLCGITENGTVISELPHLMYEDEVAIAKRSERVWSGEQKPTRLPEDMSVDRS